MPELAVVIPVLNERDNLPPMIEALEKALSSIDFELVVVDDDSPDGSAEVARTLARNHPQIRVLQRIHRKGLSSAVIEGMMSSSAPYLAVIDADMQHDETILPAMLAKLKSGNFDLVVGSRNISGGSMGKFAADRLALSNFGKRLSRLVYRADLTDPMSGYFVLDRRFLEEVVRGLSSTGFKLLIDLLASSHRPIRIAEVGYAFRQRLRGESKLDILVGLEYVKLLVDKLVGNWIPVNFVIFSGVGLLGMIIYLTLVKLQMSVVGTSFAAAQGVASSIVIAINFLFNNILTFRGNRLRGWRMLAGLAFFYLACSVGLITNVWVASGLRSSGIWWPFASAMGVVLGSVWNYWMTSVFVWRVNSPRSVAAR
jgi:dolichol-phosphate mannosyltransferase